jgi:hypothetical protein
MGEDKADEQRTPIKGFRQPETEVAERWMGNVAKV